MFFSDTAMKVYSGILLMVLVSGSWVCATQFLKATYITAEDTSKLSTADVIIFSAPFFRPCYKKAPQEKGSLN